jgi:hypothetical protein
VGKFSLVCPYCDVHSTFTFGTSFGNSSIYECDKCSGLVLLIFEDRKVVDQYPKRIPQLDDSIPSEVANDYIEAIKCFDVGANKASVVMCRRALQTSVIERGAKRHKLTQQIDELFKKGIITKDIKDWAHEIRLTGNIGAHPDEDGLKDVTPKDAEELIRFIEEYLNYVYVMPSKVTAKRTREKKQSEA